MSILFDSSIVTSKPLLFIKSTNPVVFVFNVLDKYFLSPIDKKTGLSSEARTKPVLMINFHAFCKPRRFQLLPKQVLQLLVLHSLIDQ